MSSPGAPSAGAVGFLRRIAVPVALLLVITAVAALVNRPGLAIHM